MPVVLKYLLQLRFVIIAAAAVAAVVVEERFDLALPWATVGAVLLAMTAYSLWSWRHWRDGRPVPDTEFIRQVLADLLALSVLVYYTGGPVNPFISLFLLPIVFAAATLPLGSTIAVAAVAVGVYTLLMFFYVPVVQSHAMHGAQLHLWGMWYGFVISASGVAFFVSRIARSLRRRDQALAAAREQALEAERAIALGTLAAGTAHELGTPLATMAILAGELAAELQDPQQREVVATLRGQLARCKQSLARLAVDAGALPADSGRAERAAVFVRTLLEDWRAGRTEPVVDLRIELEEDSPLIVVERTLQQALVNVLNNAAEASRQRVEVTARCSGEALRLEVRDDGPGVGEALRERLGREVVTTKGEQGLGLGLYLAHSVLRRLGGSVAYESHAEGGTTVVVDVPFTFLRTAG